MSDLISRKEAIKAVKFYETFYDPYQRVIEALEDLPSTQPDRLTDDDFETIRIHLNAFKETLCNQRRWKEAEEYQRIIDRFMSFASAQPRKGKWIYGEEAKIIGNPYGHYRCDQCNEVVPHETHFCPKCGADMRG